MKSSILVIFLVFNSWAVRAQFETKNNYTGTWNDVASWSAGQPNPLTTNIDDEANIYGYITREGSLSFANIGNNADEIIIYDTLVVEGNMTFETNSISLKVETGGLLVIFGDFVANNKVDLENGGTMVIIGDMTLNGGSQDYIDNGGGLYVDGEITGNGDTGDADGTDQPSTNLNNTGDNGKQKLFDFIQNGGSTSLPITLGSFEAKSNATFVELKWTTLSEENFSYFEIQRSSDGFNFEIIERVDGQGFASQSTNYVFLDYTPLYGQGYYRLNAIDYDGTNEIFQTIQVVHRPESVSPVIYPNPSNGQSVSVMLHLDQLPTNQQFLITNANGRVVFESEDLTNFNLDGLSGLPRGLYFVKIQIDNLVFNEKLIVN